MPDYSDHMPTKKKALDANNLKDNLRKKDHMYADILGATSTGGKGN